jgi:hypothetical protein
MFPHTINSIRIDFKPNVNVRDLNVGKVKQILGLRKHGIIKRKHYTIKYTHSLYLNVWVKQPFHFDAVFKHVDILRRQLNAYKRTKVLYFTAINIVNVQGSGNLEFSLSKALLKRLDLTTASPERISIEVVQDTDIPAVPIDNISKLAQYAFQSLLISINSSNFITVKQSGTFSIVTKDLKIYLTLLNVLIYINGCGRFEDIM